MPHHLRMLVVDDNDDIRKSLTHQFTMEDFDVTMAENGEVALDKIKKDNYDIVLLDIKMPKMDGKAMLLELKKISKYPYVIMLTGVDDLSVAHECVKLGAKDYIQKPYDPEELLHIVIKVLGS